MSDFFDGARFSRLLKAHWTEARSKYSWFICIAAIVNLIFMVISFSSDSSHRFTMFQYQSQIAWYCFGLFTTGIIFAGLHFKDLTNPGSALITLMRPASHFEKWLMAVLVVSLMFPLVYTFFFCVMNFPAIALAKILYVPTGKCMGCNSDTADFRFFLPFFTAEKSDRVASISSLFVRSQFFMLLILWTVQSMILCGTAFFKYSPILKTALTLFILWILMLWVAPQPVKGPFWSEADFGLDPFYSPIEVALSLVHWAGLPLIFWCALFFHLKEREVA